MLAQERGTSGMSYEGSHGRQVDAQAQQHPGSMTNKEMDGTEGQSCVSPYIV